MGIDPTPSRGDSIGSLEGNDSVLITQQGNYFLFKPTTQSYDVGFIFYPGGHVDPQAYNHLLKEIAAEGYFVVLVPMPLNLAVLGSQKATAVIQDYPKIKTWIIAGHSVGGAMAATFTEKNLDQIDGLILWASYPPDSVDLSTSSIDALSIYGALDGISTPEDIVKSKQNLPMDTLFYEIIGG